MTQRKIQVLLVDDERYVLETVASLLAGYPDFMVAGTAGSKEEAIAFLEHHAVDAAFLDIQMKGENGFSLAACIGEKYPHICTVFLTGHAGFALEGYDYQPVDFLVKPVEKDRFAKTLQRIRNKLDGEKTEQRPVRVGIYTDEGFSLVSVEDILYLEKKNRKVAVVRKNGETLYSGTSMSELENILTDYDFCRCHQSYLIPLEKVESVSPETIGRSYHLRLRGVAEPIPVSRRKHLELKQYLQQRITLL